MLGELTTELKGKITNQRVFDAGGPTIETSISSTGSSRGVQISEILTYVGKPSSLGVLHGRGQGIVSGNSDMVPYIGEGIR